MFIAGNILQKQKGEKRYNITSICSKVWCVSLLTKATWLGFGFPLYVSAKIPMLANTYEDYFMFP